MLALLSQGEGREYVWLIPTWSVEIEHYLALIVLAHYTVLTNARLNVWWLTGLGRKLFPRISAVLGETDDIWRR